MKSNDKQWRGNMSGADLYGKVEMISPVFQFCPYLNYLHNYNSTAYPYETKFAFH